ncbi:carboxypeptidase-like regulatory domain-containing protein [Rhodocaloribacter litoris]|uniref:carboxypeptidase-like regulatory domain-containing protein n=1 Tax=Rhodocaloribacter litoris TaxID=2558931 RepID=UPI0014224E41|nr:carboxypeptidase-like regulatory domain-containing protein [Rhodocaloribacter litoris]QXD15525.1 carboxypeptidase-like regulatory domain-containing protein [Rhodocaloribacter litoris]
MYSKRRHAFAVLSRAPAPSRHVMPFRALLPALSLCLAVAYRVPAQPAPAVFTGTVVDAETGVPLPGAHVFIAGSMIGTTTDNEGRYRLERVPPGAHRLYVSMVGFEPAFADTLVTARQTLTFDARLVPAVIELGEIRVEARADKKWQKRLKQFIRQFIGETPNAAETEILNPEVLDFDGNWWGKLEARAAAPLLIENRALGYRIRYFLKEFVSTGVTIKYDGEPLFEEMPPRDAAEAERWRENRRRAFFGSFRHFMLAALGDSTRTAGFVTYRLPSLDSPERHRLRFPVTMSDVLKDGPTEETRTLKFFGYIEVHYLGEEEEEAFLRWERSYYRRTPGPQRSWIRLTDGPTAVDPTGTIVDPYGVTVYGYFAFERVADELPKEYRPD